jgi:hypothetical protein
LPVANKYDYSDAIRLWSELTGGNGTRIVKFKRVWSVGGLLWYLLGYVLKDWLVEFGDAKNFVEVMRSLHRKRLVRAFGCLYGVRKEPLRKPVGSSAVPAAEAERSGAEHILAKDSTKSLAVCVKCGGSEFEFFTEEIGTDSLVHPG